MLLLIELQACGRECAWRTSELADHGTPALCGGKVSIAGGGYELQCLERLLSLLGSYESVQLEICCRDGNVSGSQHSCRRCTCIGGETSEVTSRVSTRLPAKRSIF